MKEILLLAFVIFSVAEAALWMADKRKWERQSKKLEERARENLQQKEKMDTRIIGLEQELVQIKEENAQLRTEVQALIRQGDEKDRRLSDRQETVRKAAVKIHLYIQLLKEQCEMGTAQRQCDIILRECENLLRKQR